MPSTQRQGGIGILFLLLQIMTLGNRIPPVTLLLVAIQVLIYTNFLALNMPTIGEVCVSNVYVWYREQYQRLMLAPFFHLSDIHLYYNMASFLYKGIYLEPLLGSPHFLAMLLMFAGLSSAGTLPLNLAGEALMHESHYLLDCAAGFSGVIFAMKVVAFHFLPNERVYFFVIPVPSRWVVWLELGLIQLLVPNVSFVGHLSGILVGLLYTQGPLSTLLGTVVPPDTGSNWGRRRYTYSASATGYRPQEDNQSGTVNREDYTAYTGGLSEEEQLQWAAQQSVHAPQDQRRPNASELRRLRTARFEQMHPNNAR